MELVELNKASQKSLPILNELEKRLVKTIQKGLPLVSRPYAAVASELSIDEDTVIEMIGKLIKEGYIKRHGIVVRHRDLGYSANAMVVWDVPDKKLDSVPHQMKEYPFVTLCYRRPRKLPEWPYNVFCMIHGRDRDSVRKNLKEMINSCQWHDIKREVLFSKRRFKQRGAHYIHQNKAELSSAINR